MRKPIQIGLLTVSALALLASNVAFGQSFSSIPLSGKARFDAWPGYFWSYFAGEETSGIAGGLAYRYADGISPAEKFDDAFGFKAKKQLTQLAAWGKCAYAAKKDCMPKAGQPNRVDYTCLRSSKVVTAYNACKKGFTVNSATEHEVVNQGIGKKDADFWWGICHGWAGAAVLFPEPIKAITYNKVKFRVGDIKGLLSSIATTTNLEPDGWVGCRYGGPGATNLYAGCATEKEVLDDVTPAQYHRTMGKFLGLRNKGVVVDRYTGAEVWNQPSDQFVTTCRAGGTGCSSGSKAHTCTTKFTWAEDGVNPDVVANGDRRHGYYTTRTLSYTLCVKNDQIEGDGKWNHDANIDVNSRHPDFIWVPSSVGTSKPSNPIIHAKRALIIDKLAKPSAGSSTTTTPTKPKEYKTRKKTLNKAIPDNNPTGITYKGRFGSSKKTLASLSVCVDITHTYQGDLHLKVKYRGVEDVIRNKEGGSADNLKECISTSKLPGLKGGATLYLTVSDLAGQDVGTLNSYYLTYTYK